MCASPYDDWFPDATIDGTYGRDERGLLTITPADSPEGFAQRWRTWYAAALSASPVTQLDPAFRTSTHDVSVVTFTTLDGLRLRAWLASPLAGVAEVGIVHGHGYGPIASPSFDRVPANAAAIFPLARGFGALNEDVGGPSDKALHVVTGIADVETYLPGLCARDLWTAASALHTVLGALPLYYVGESFGGGLGALAIPWDSRFIGATLIVPTFGQYDERLQLECLGSGEAQRMHVAAYPEARDVLRFFDASVSASRFTVPVRVEAALWDIYVPPPGQFAVANAVPESLRELHVLAAGHAEFPGLQEQRHAAIAGGLEHFSRTLATSGATRPPECPSFAR